MPIHETSSEAETSSLAASLAAKCRAGDLFLLSGPLGAGKSVFSRAFIRALCGEETEVPSPTFTLVQNYECAKGTIWHYDLYRLEDPEEIFELGWEEAMVDGISLVEWPQKLGEFTPMYATRIAIEPLDGDKRKITVDTDE
jgi:tRNA threonylcarbamoyladenosine biosynthesis protein TsaE